MSYESVKSQMQTGDLLLWHSDTILGALIRLKCGFWNHAGLVLRVPEYEGKEDRRWTLEALEDGVVLNLLSARLESFKGTVKWFPLHPAFDLERSRIGERAMAFAGKPYDYGSLFKNIFGHVSAEAGSLFCSEMVFLSMGCTGTAPRPDEMLALNFWDESKGVQIK